MRAFLFLVLFPAPKESWWSWCNERGLKAGKRFRCSERNGVWGVKGKGRWEGAEAVVHLRSFGLLVNPPFLSLRCFCCSSCFVCTLLPLSPPTPKRTSPKTSQTKKNGSNDSGNSPRVMNPRQQLLPCYSLFFVSCFSFFHNALDVDVRC